MTKRKGQAASYAPYAVDLFSIVACRPAALLLPLALMAGLAASPAAAQVDKYWDANQDGDGRGGTGVWDPAVYNWSPNNDGTSGPYNATTAWDNAAFDNAIFGYTGGTVTLGVPINVHNMTFEVGGFILEGEPLTLGGDTPTITGAATIESIIQGNAGLVKAGGGNLNLNGANTFSGGIVINGGGINAADDQALGDASNTITIDGGGFSSGTAISGRNIILAGDASLGGLAGSAQITGTGNVYVGNGFTFNNDASTYVGDTRFGGSNGQFHFYFTSIGNTGEASSVGSAGAIIVTGARNYSDSLHYTGGATSTDRTFRFNGGTSSVNLVNDGGGELALTGSISLEGGAVGFNASSADLALTGTISQTVDTGVGFGGSGIERTITLGGGNSYSGAPDIRNVTVVATTLANIGDNSSLGTGATDSTVYINNGALSYTGGVTSTDRTWLISNNVNIRNDGTGELTLDGALEFNPGTGIDALTLGGSFGGVNTISSNITGSGRVAMDGAGTWVLSGDNDYTGTTTVQNGTLRAGSATAFNPLNAAIVNGGVLDLNGYDYSFTKLDGTGGEVALGGADLTLNVAAGVAGSYAGAITGNGNFTKLGAGQQTLTGANTYTGDTNIGGGTLELSFVGGGGPTSDIIAATSTLNMAGGTLSVVGVAGEGNSQTFADLNIDGGSSKITASGEATVNLGAVNRTAGLIDFGIGTGTTMTVDPGTTLGGWATVNGSDYADVNASNEIVAFTNYDLKDDAANWLDGDIVTDTGGDPNTPFYNTVSDAGDGVVQLGGLRYTVAAGSQVDVAAGQTLGVDGTIIIASTASSTKRISGGSVRGSAGGVLGIQQNSAGDFIIDSTIVDNAGATGLTVSGSGTGDVVLTNTANQYTGATRIAAEGTLTVAAIADGGAASSIGMSSAAASNLVLEGGTLYYNGGTATTDRGFTVMRSGAIQGGTIVVADSAANLTFEGEVLGPDGAGLTKTGSGTLTLANAGSTYTGVTTVSQGTLAVTTLTDGGVASSIGVASSDPANIVLQTGGVLDYLGGTTSSNRGVTLAPGAGGGGIGVSDPLTTLTMSGTIVGSTYLTKHGDGTLVLSGTNTYTGGTVVRGGILRAGSTQAFGTGAMHVAAGTTLDLDGNDNTVAGLNDVSGSGGTVTLGGATLTTNGSGSFSGRMTGTGGLTVTGGIQTMTGCTNDYTGVTTIDGGTLSTDCLADGDLASGIGASSAAAENLVIGNNSVLSYTGADVAIDRGFTLSGGWGYIDVTEATTELEFEGEVVGSGGLRKRQPGTLILSGNNSYLGGTTVEEGVLRAESNSAFGTGGMWLEDVAGVTLDLNNFDNTVGYLNRGGATGGNITLGSATLTIDWPNGAARYAGAISGTGGLIKNGGLTQYMEGCDSSYSGSTVINDGWLGVTCLEDGGENSSIGSSDATADNLVIGNGSGHAGLYYTGAGSTTNRQFTMDSNDVRIYSMGTGALQFTSEAAIVQGTSYVGDRNFRLGGTNTDDNTFAAQITDASNGTVYFRKEDSGTWRLTNTNSSYTGATTVVSGVLEVTKLADGGLTSSIGASSAAAANLLLVNQAHLTYVGTEEATTNRLFMLGAGTNYIESSGSAAVNFTGTGGGGMEAYGGGERTLALGGTYAGDNIMGVVIADQNATTGKTTLAKNDAGTWILTGNNTYTGNTVINDGRLIIGNGGMTGNVGTGEVILAHATGVLGFNRSDTVTFNGVISGPGTIDQMGEGTTILTAENSAGTTRISEGTLEVNGDLTTDAIIFEEDDGEATTLTVNSTVQGTGGAPAAITGDDFANIINVNTGGVLTANGDLGGGSDTVDVSGTLDTGAGVLRLGLGNDTLSLNDTATFSGGGVDAGTGGESGIGDTLQVATTAGLTLAGANVTNFETLSKQGTGTLTLTGNHSYSAGTTITAGTLQVGNGATAGALATPTVANNGVLAFNLNSNYSFAGAISGSGDVNKLGTGITTLTGTNSYGGATNVNAGTLLVNGDQTAATGLTSVAGGATLGGTGIIGGSVAVADGGTLSPGGAGSAPGTLTINGGLTLDGGSTVAANFGQANVPGGPYNDLITVGGDLVLDGTLDVTETPGGTFGPGVYRVFSYGGALTNDGLDVSSPDYFVQTSVANQVNLVNSTGLALSFWDGDAGPHSNEVVNGGNGTWRAAGDTSWTDSTGLFAAPFDNASFAVFQGAAGTVSVDNASGQVQALGMQFAADGYLVQDGGIELVDDGTQPGPQSIIRVGDGSAAGAAYVATISSNLSGATQLVKTDLGTLVLSGTNTYASGTAINGGTVEISDDANLGAAGSALSLDDGRLRNTAAVTSGRTVTLDAGGGTFDTLATFTLNGAVGGTGQLTKTSAGTLVLAGANSYQGGTVINGGTVEVSANANLGDGSGGLTFDGGTLHSTGTFTAARSVTLNAGGGTFDTDGLTTLTLVDAIGGAGALSKNGGGSLVLAGTNTYGGGTTISDGTLQLGAGDASGSITGDVMNDGTLAFNRNDTYTFAGLISGAGALEQLGSGITVLTADNSYAGETDVREGTLIVNGDQSAATGITTVEDGGALGGIGTIGGDVAALDGGALNPGDVGTTPGALTINGALTLGAGAALNYNFGQADVVGGAYNDLTVVHGNLVLDGTLNVAETPGGDFGPGVYRVISYDGTLTNRGLSEGSPDHVVQTSIAGQVNLVDISNLTLNFWDGEAGPKDNDLVDGGNGIWRAAGDDNWTQEAGDINAAFSNGSFAIFAGTAGTVDVDNTNGQVRASGMQFATGGYVIQGEAVTLEGPQSTIRVGDGTATGATYVATIASILQGDSELLKRDLGTLVLTGSNTYTGGTLIREGTVQIASDTNLGDATGGLTLNGGILQNTAAIDTGRGVALGAGGGTFLTDADLTLSGSVGGAGGFTKTGSAALVLTGANTYAGPSTVAAGSLFVNGNQTGATGLTSVEGGATLGGNGTLGGSVTIADGGVLNPGAADGTPGTLAIASDLALSSGTVLNYSFGEANVAGGTRNDLTTVGGGLVLDGTLNVSVSPGGTFDPGIYRVFSYDGTLTDNGLKVGTIPSASYFVQTAIANQVNLVNTAGLTLNYWDGDTGPKFDGVIDGGDGVWQSSAGNDNWTDAAGAINAGFSDGAFAVFSGKPGTVTVDNDLGQVRASGMQFAVDGYVVEGDAIGLAGPAATIRVGDGTNAAAGMTATIASELTGGSQLVKTDEGTLVLTGSNSYSGGTAINGGTLQVASDANIGDVSGGLSFDGGTLQTTASFASGRAINLLGQGTLLTDAGTTLTLNGALSGAGSLSKKGQGTTVIDSDAAGFTGTTSVEGGTLAINGSLCGEINVRDGGRLQGTGTVCDTNNFAGGTVAPGNSIGTLMVAGNYAGTGGTLEIEAELGGDASPTDRLVVTGDTSGTSNVEVTNLGGGGAQTVEGISIIEVDGASNGSFSLTGDYLFEGEQAVVGGAYAYRLYKGGVSTPSDGDWYLRSTYMHHPADPEPQPLYSPAVPLYEAYAGALQAFNELGTLQQRVGNRSWGPAATPQGADLPEAGPIDGSAIWARIEAAHTQLDPQTSTTGTDYEVATWRLQAGVDGLLHEGADGVLIGGITTHFGTISADVTSIFGAGEIDATGYGFGGTLTWYGNSGFYVDAQAQATWYDTDLTSRTLGTSLADGNDAFGYALGLEAGQRVALNNRWSLTPQAQLAHSSVDFDDFTDPYGAAVSLREGDRLIGRIGLSVDYEDQWADETGEVSRAHVYGIANLYHDFLDGSTVNVSGTQFASENQALWGGLGVGATLSWADGRYTAFGEAAARSSLEDFGDSFAVGAKLGLRMQW